MERMPELPLCLSVDTPYLPYEPAIELARILQTPWKIPLEQGMQRLMAVGAVYMLSHASINDNMLGVFVISAPEGGWPDLWLDTGF
jgi:hypothetical protein